MRNFLNFSTAVVLLVGSALYCSAKTVQVGSCKIGPTNYPSIQNAVDASSAGDTVDVCPGTYHEQVSINKALNLYGVAGGNLDAPVIVAPTSGVTANATSLATGNPIAAQVAVLSAAGLVNVKNIVVNGKNNGMVDCSGPELVGILYQNTSGTVSRVAAMNQALVPAAAGCQNGLGIFVQSGNGGTSVVTVSNNVVGNYQKNGITGNEVGTNVTVSGNSVYGQGPTTGAAENSIQIGFGATGKVMNNLVGDDIWSPDVFGDTGDAAAGILVYASSGVTTSGNVVSSTQYGIAYASDPTLGAADGGTITLNKVSATHLYDGIDVCSNNNTIQKNTINASDEAGVHLDSTCGGTGVNNTVMSNTVNLGCAGILDGGSGNTYSGNLFYNTKVLFATGTDVCSPAVAAPTPRAKARSRFGAARP